MPRRPALVAAALVLALPIVAAPLRAQGGKLTAKLRSFEEVPSINSSGSGRFRATISDKLIDWNISEAWLKEMRSHHWWNEHIKGALASYWVYQHLGNLSPAELAADPLYARVRAVPDGTEALRRHAAGADADPARTRWSYQRIFGRVQLLMVDTRAARVLPEGRRAMLDDGEAAWLRDKVLADPSAYDHILIGSSLPWLLPPLAHDAETWNAAWRHAVGICAVAALAEARVGDLARQLFPGWSAEEEIELLG